MESTDWFNLFLLFCLFSYIVYRLIAKDVHKGFEKLENKIDEMTTNLDDLGSKIKNIEAEIEDMSLTDHEKEERIFNNAPNLNISFFEKLKKGQTLRLMIGSYTFDYPSENISIVEFQYRHDHVDKENKTEYGWEVHGFEKFDEGDWSPCTFFAKEDKCTTSSCAGTVKRVMFG